MEANNRRAMLLTAIAPVAWGSTYFVTKHWLPTGIPLTGAVIRALPAGVLLMLVSRRLPSGQWWWRSAVISALTVGGFFALIYVVGQHLPSGVAATLMACSAPAMMALSWLLLGERLGRLAIAGAVAGVAGVTLLVGGSAAGIDVVGVGASLAAMLASSLGFVLAKRWNPPVPPLVFSSWQLTMGGLMLAPLALLVEGPSPALTSSEYAAFGYVVLIATALSYVVWFHGLRILPASTVGIIGLLNPVSGAVLGVAAGGERLTPLQLAGMAIVLLGIAAGTRPGRAITSSQSRSTASQPQTRPVACRTSSAAAGGSIGAG